MQGQRAGKESGSEKWDEHDVHDDEVEPEMYPALRERTFSSAFGFAARASESSP